MALGKVSTKPVNVLNGRAGAFKTPYRDATAAVAAKIGRSDMGGNGVMKHTPPCGACGGRKK